MIPFICIWKMAYEIIKVFPNVSKASNLTNYGWTAVIFAIVGIFVYFGALMCTHISAFRTVRNMNNEAILELFGAVLSVVIVGIATMTLMGDKIIR